VPLPRLEAATEKLGGMELAEISFASNYREDGTLTIPREAVEELGLHPGDQLEIRAVSSHEILGPEAPRVLDDVLAPLLVEASNLDSQPGKESSDPYERAFGEIIKEKYRKMGLDV
jgi:bifunctional DNA-binding transcriptional regulator/antitoxin component of YhaV-PrlF toxin-antitoxin module